MVKMEMNLFKGEMLTWQENSLPIGHMGLVCRGGAKARTCSSSKAGMKFSLYLLWKNKHKVTGPNVLETPPVLPESCQTAGTVHNQNLGHTPDQKPTSPPSAKAQRAWSKSWFSFVQEGQQMQNGRQHVRSSPISPNKKFNLSKAIEISCGV